MFWSFIIYDFGEGKLCKGGTSVCKRFLQFLPLWKVEVTNSDRIEGDQGRIPAVQVIVPPIVKSGCSRNF